MNALFLAVCGDHPDVVKMLVDEFDVSLKTKGPVSIKSLTHAWLYTLVCKCCM